MGEDTAIRQLIGWCQVGPPDARVAHVEAEGIPLRGIPDKFVIYPDA